MGSLFRSEELVLCQMYLPPEGAYHSLQQLGELGAAQFVDLNEDVNAQQRQFVVDVRRCEDMERQLRYFVGEIQKEDIKIPDDRSNPDPPMPGEINAMKISFDQLERDVRAANEHYTPLLRNWREVQEMRAVIRHTAAELANSDFMSADPMLYQANGVVLDPDTPHKGDMRLVFVAGVVARGKVAAFERTLWRVCLGNVFVKLCQPDTFTEDPGKDGSTEKVVFIVFVRGDLLRGKVLKLCEGYEASVYPCPSDPGELADMVEGAGTRIQDLQVVLEQTKEHRRRILVSAAKNIAVWNIKVQKMKAIFHTLNMFDMDTTGRRCLVGECWCPLAELEAIRLAMCIGMPADSVPPVLQRVPTDLPPPTYNRTNLFTKVFQGIVDAYGVANYREVNPAPFTIISFPFLFSVMFGDAGHGVLVFAFALFMIMYEKRFLAQKDKGEIWKTFFNGRYVILLMGLFSIYSGFLYNDVYSKSVNIFGSAWHSNTTIFNNRTLSFEGESLITFDPGRDYDGDPYQFGIDPVWQMSKNKITFLNTFKMKLSVVIGVAHMYFGVFLSAFNHSGSGNRLNLLAEFIPQTIFLGVIFVYLNLLIIYKWVAYDFSTSFQAPSLLIHLINMFLMSYPKDPISATVFYNGQQYFQYALLILAVLCIPWLLLVKPFVLRSRNKKNPDPKFDFPEVFIHQAIHTIEYCLGCVSHTASYLRLWALSLAHAELSEVLWVMVLGIGLKMDLGYYTGILIWALWAAWAVLAVAILLLMEGLSAFLHTIRLHWVEFQSKFYMGAGVKFLPFTFRKIRSITSSE